MVMFEQGKHAHTQAHMKHNVGCRLLSLWCECDGCVLTEAPRVVHVHQAVTVLGSEGVGECEWE